jgi:DNA polymerase-3 subunit delta'
MQLPWFEAQKNTLMRGLKQKRLAHAFLLSGSSGIGKLLFAQSIAKTALCQHEIACGQCQSCLLIKAGTHPDFLQLEPTGKANMIKVDQVRTLAPFLNKTPSLGGYKLVVIGQIDAMNVASSNAILKTLEEPAGKTLILSVTSQVQKLLPTIRSRCQLLALNAPDKTSAKNWLLEQGCTGALDVALELCEGAPLTAKKMLEEGSINDRLEILRQFYTYLQKKTSLVVIAEQWSKLSANHLFDLLMMLISDVLKDKDGVPEDQLTLASQIKAIRAIGRLVDEKYLTQFYQKLLTAKKESALSCNLNPQMVVEQLLL